MSVAYKSDRLGQSRCVTTALCRTRHRGSNWNVYLAIDNLCIDRLYIGSMGKRPELLPGTLDMLILKTLGRAPMHGYGIALAIKQLSDDVLTVEEGSLYPALQRLLLRGLVRAEWKTSETNRRARYYTLTPAGRKQLGIELSEFEQMIAAIGRVLQQA